MNKPVAENTLIYRIGVVESKLGVSRSTIYRMVSNGELDLVKIGRRSSGITAASVHAMIERNKKLFADTMAASELHGCDGPAT
ncbi:helix-turn-helix domain-containing protein [Alcaligenaceae bacterium SJ-26]|nr:helix-turn-helix domain-containing protein [Alcaligenaceae bacterium SJ-26]